MSLMLLHNSGESRPTVTIVIFACHKAAPRAGATSLITSLIAEGGLLIC